MIRINLLAPAEAKKKKRQISTSGSYSAIFVLILVLEVLGLYYWGDQKAVALAEKNRANDKIEAELKEYEALKAQQEDLKKKIDEEQRQTQIFDKLHFGRVGPGNMMLFLSYILTRPPLENREERVIQEQLGWNTAWDTERAWFKKVSNLKGTEIVIEGVAISHIDTDELLKRLRSTIYLQNLRLIHSTRKQSKEVDNASSIEFRFDAVVNYDLEAGKKEEEEAKKGKGKDKKPGKGKKPAKPESKKG
jgi:hypothetical protein